MRWWRAGRPGRASADELVAKADTEPPVKDEQARVRRRRYWEALDAGLTEVEARLFSESPADIGELRRLVKDGCPLETIRKIVL